MTTRYYIREQLETLEEKLAELDRYEDKLIPNYKQKRKELIFLRKHTKIQKFKAKHNYNPINSLDFYKRFIDEFQTNINALDRDYHVGHGCHPKMQTVHN